MKKLIILTLSVLFTTSFTLTAQSKNTETTQQKVQSSNNVYSKVIKQNPSFISERQAEKTSTNKMMNNCPMIKNIHPEKLKEMMNNCAKIKEITPEDQQQMLKKCQKMMKMPLEERKNMMNSCPMIKNIHSKKLKEMMNNRPKIKEITAENQQQMLEKCQKMMQIPSKERQNMMKNSPMMKCDKMDSSETKSKDDTTQYNLNTSAK